jgi:membrane-associated phospholipid phosphatase
LIIKGYGEVLRFAQDDNIVKKRVVVSLALSILFLVVYGGCNWMTAQRGNVGTLYFEWERGIPFVPFFIAPYMSIDLFFVAAPFLCRSCEELKIFSRRIAAAIVVAGICFLIFPLRFAFPRPHPGGFLGAIFDWFRAMDAPYNQFPSLHAALMLLLVDLYWRRTRGLLRIAITMWFVLIALSPLLTHQHHVIDIIGGVALAVACFIFIREREFSSLPNSAELNNRPTHSRV